MIILIIRYVFYRIRGAAHYKFKLYNLHTSIMKRVYIVIFIMN